LSTNLLIHLLSKHLLDNSLKICIVHKAVKDIPVLLNPIDEEAFESTLEDILLCPNDQPAG